MRLALLVSVPIVVPAMVAAHLPLYVKTNVRVFHLPAGRQRLFFFPDRVFVKDGNRYGVVAYANLVCRVGSTQFLEEEGVPGDSQVISHTWKYVNKSGGPDRRFRDNRQIPITVYGELTN